MEAELDWGVVLNHFISRKLTCCSVELYIYVYIRIYTYIVCFRVNTNVPPLSSIRRTGISVNGPCLQIISGRSYYLQYIGFEKNGSRLLVVVVSSVVGKVL